MDFHGNVEERKCFSIFSGVRERYFDGAYTIQDLPSNQRNMRGQ